MAYTIIIPGNAQADHPAFGIAQKAKEALATIGITLNISDPADAQEMWTALDSGRAEMWAAAFGETLDPDMAQNYASENLPTNEGGTGRNTYFITDNTLDQLMSAARASSDTAYRKDVYRDCLNMIMDWRWRFPPISAKTPLFSVPSVLRLILCPPTSPLFIPGFPQLKQSNLADKIPRHAPYAAGEAILAAEKP